MAARAGFSCLSAGRRNSLANCSRASPAAANGTCVRLLTRGMYVAILMLYPTKIMVLFLPRYCNYPSIHPPSLLLGTASPKQSFPSSCHKCQPPAQQHGQIKHMAVIGQQTVFDTLIIIHITCSISNQAAETGMMPASPTISVAAAEAVPWKALKRRARGEFLSCRKS